MFAGEHNHIAAAGFCFDHPFYVPDGDVAAAGLQLQIAADIADIDGVAARFHRYGTADIIHTDFASAAADLDTSGDAGRFDRAASGFNSDKSRVAGNANHKLAGKFAWSPAIPLADDPCGVALHVRTNFERSKLAARVLFGRIRMALYHIGNVLLLAAVHHHRTQVQFDAQVFGRSHGARRSLA